MSQIISGVDLSFSYSPQPQALIKTKSNDYLIAGRAFNGSQPDTGFAVLYNPYSGNPVIWEESYSGQYSTMFLDAALLKDGNFIAVGIWFTSVYAGDENIWLVKINSTDGSVIWQKNIGEKGVKRDGYAVTASKDGGFVVSSLAIKHGSSELNNVVMKFDANGDQEWSTYLDDKVGYSIITTQNGNYAMCGATAPDSGGNNQIFAALLDPSGKILWEKTYTTYSIYVLLNSDITENSNGDFTIAAKSVLMRITGKGNVIWEHQNIDLVLNSVIEAKDDTYAVAGSRLINGMGFQRAYVAGVDQSGVKLLWDNTEITYNSNIPQIVFDDEQNIVTTGSIPYGPNTSELFACVFANAKVLFL